MRNTFLASILCGLILFPAMVVADSSDNQGTESAMQRSFDPQVYANLVGQIMQNPMAMMTNPMGSCAHCHSGEDSARYAQTFGPMMQMMNSANWMNPGSVMPQQMMAKPMDPQSYAKWYEAWMKKFGGMMGQSKSTDQ
ncbi:MAG: hypothetical protein QGF90_02870 [Gammaproteobacteria bacterium]|nr:hypothetical protein [Gammaproteobacteria bacterium]